MRANALCPGSVPATIGDQAHGLRRLTYRHSLTRIPFVRSLDRAVDTDQMLATDPETTDRTLRDGRLSLVANCAGPADGGPGHSGSAALRWVRVQVQPWPDRTNTSVCHSSASNS